MVCDNSECGIIDGESRKTTTNEAGCEDCIGSCKVCGDKFFIYKMRDVKRGYICTKCMRNT